MGDEHYNHCWRQYVRAFHYSYETHMLSNIFKALIQQRHFRTILKLTTLFEGNTT